MDYWDYVFNLEIYTKLVVVLGYNSIAAILDKVASRLKATN
jgi:hypothetical protein